MTVTVAAPDGTSSPNQANITSGGGGLNTGAAVGIAIGVVAILVGAAAVAFFFWRRKKQRDAEAGVAFHTPSPRGSSAGMNASKMAEASTTPPFLVRHPTDGNWESDQSGRRRSTLMPIDPRIDPAHSGIYNRHENVSRDSINSLRDDQDYSRRVAQPKILRATNPDPDLD
jgi:cell wall integrity and stress response component